MTGLFCGQQATAKKMSLGGRVKHAVDSDLLLKGRCSCCSNTYNRAVCLPAEGEHTAVDSVCKRITVFSNANNQAADLPAEGESAAVGGSARAAAPVYKSDDTKTFKRCKSGDIVLFVFLYCAACFFLMYNNYIYYTLILHIQNTFLWGIPVFFLLKSYC